MASRNGKLRAQRKCAFVVLACLSLLPATAGAQETENPCPRPSPASTVRQPPELRSHNGRLELTLNFRISEDGQGLTRFCYLSDSGLQSPTLRVKPGDELVIHFRNQLPAGNVGPAAHSMEHDSMCADAPPSMAATNLHFHGLDVPPRCHQDDVMRTLIGPAESFDYRLKIPLNAAPGLYWYHPHPHDFGEVQVQGGASGALIVEGIAAARPEVTGLPERILVLRDQKLPLRAHRVPGEPMPGWDVSLNYVPVPYPEYFPAVLHTTKHRAEFWRVLNAAADTIFDLQVLVNNAPRPLRLVAIDGVPLSKTLIQTEILLPPGSRAEFIVHTPRADDRAQLVSKAWDTGPDGENDPKRPLATILSTNQTKRVSGSSTSAWRLHQPKTPALLTDQRWRRGITEPTPSGVGEGCKSIRAPEGRHVGCYYKSITPAALRKLYFSEIKEDPNFAGTSFYLTVDGQQPKRYKMDAPPNIVVHQGNVEDWTIENRSREDHVFHIHQIHFQVLERDGKPVPDGELRDTIDVPFWNGKGPYPSVKLRMDFRDPNTVGTLMYHCHILQHSANGMMGAVEVLPPEIE